MRTGRQKETGRTAEEEGFKTKAGEEAGWRKH